MTRRRSTLVVALCSSIALMAAACAGDDDDDDDTETGEGELGVVEIAPDDPILLGALQVVSGENASLGTDQQRAIEIAIADRDGELLGHEIELQVEDEQCTADGGTAAAQRLASEAQVVGALGTSCSGAAVPAAEILGEEGIAMLSGSNTSPSLTSDLEGTEGDNHQPTYLRTAHNDIVQGQAAAAYAYDELGAKKAVTVHDGDPYTEGLTTAFEKSFTELGGEVSLATSVNPEDTNMRSVLTEVAAQSPDLVFFPIFQPAADHIAAQAKEFPELENTEKLMGADGLLSDTFVVLPDTEGMYFSGPATPTGGEYEEFAQKYQEEYGEAPIQAFHAHTYDATNLMLDAIEAVAEEADDGSITLDRQALLDELLSTDGYEGLTGTLTCDEFGDCADPKIDIVQNTEAQTTIEDVRGNVLFTFEPEE